MLALLIFSRLGSIHISIPLPFSPPLFDRF
jgi:hypothetical protein